MRRKEDEEKRKIYLKIYSFVGTKLISSLTALNLASISYSYNLLAHLTRGM